MELTQEEIAVLLLLVREPIDWRPIGTPRTPLAESASRVGIRRETLLSLASRGLASLTAWNPNDRDLSRPETTFRAFLTQKGKSQLPG